VAFGHDGRRTRPSTAWDWTYQGHRLSGHHADKSGKTWAPDVFIRGGPQWPTRAYKEITNLDRVLTPEQPPRSDQAGPIVRLTKARNKKGRPVAGEEVGIEKRLPWEESPASRKFLKSIP